MTVDPITVGIIFCFGYVILSSVKDVLVYGEVKTGEFGGDIREEHDGS